MGPLDEAALRHGRQSTDAVTLHVVEGGPADGPAVILLHGFPEFWFGWRHQIAALAGAGDRLAVPDAPHPDTWAPYALRHPGQALRSLYVGLFQPPKLPEALLRALVESSRPGTFGEAADRCRSARVRYLPASHWVRHEEAEAVNAALIGFFGAG